MRLQAVLLALLLMLTGGGCSQEAMIRRITTAQERADAVRFIEAIRADDRAYLMTRVEADAWQESEALLPRVRAIFPRGDLHWRVTTANVTRLQAGPVASVTRQIVLEGDNGRQWFLAAVVTQSSGGRESVIAWSVAPFSAPPESANAFTLSGIAPAQWVWLALCMAMPLISLAAIVSIWRGPYIRRRILWTLASLFGVGAFTMNWTTVDTAVTPIAIHLLSAGAVRPGPYAPWFLSFSVPIGALLYFLLRRRLRANADSPTAEPAQEETATP